MATRRTLLGALVAGLVVPRLAFAQPARMASVVVLFPGDSEDDEPATRSFFDEMRRLGWVEGTNITYERLEGRGERQRSEEHTSDSSHLVISYAVFCLKKK